MEALAILVAIIVACAIPVLVILGIRAYLKTIVRAYSRKDDWVNAVPRVGVPLFLGNLGCHMVLGATRLSREMAGWDRLISTVSILLAAVALSHLFIAVRVRRGRSLDGTLFAAIILLALSVPMLTWLLCSMGSL